MKLFAFLFPFLALAQAHALESPFTNIDQIVEQLQAKQLLSSGSGQTPVRIAILDNGFKNFELEVGKSLPKATVFHTGPVVSPETQTEEHGTAMAQIVAGILDRASGGSFSYELHLYSAYGYSNFSSAINDAIAKHVDVILYSQVWEYGGFGDGAGFINQVVNKATSSGILWINAAGNFAKGTYQSTIQAGADRWVKLPGPSNSVRVQCQKNSGEKCHVRLVLAWNDFNNDVNVGTDKDLDFWLMDQNLRVVRSSNLKQQRDFPDGQQGMSKYPREIIEGDIEAGTYLVRVEVRSSNFSSSDQMRITMSGDSVVLLDSTAETEPLNPADNASVITVGAQDSEMSSRGNRKPEVLLPSLIEMNDRNTYKGSSNSAAMFAAVAAIYKSIDTSITRTTLLQKWNNHSGSHPQQPIPQPTPAPQPTPVVQPQPAPQPQPVPQPTVIPAPPLPDAMPGNGLPLQYLNFGSTGDNCFERTVIQDPPYSLVQLLRDGGIAVKTTAGTKVIVSVDPLSIIFGLRRVNMNDMVVATDRGYFIYPRSEQDRIPRQFIEVVQMPQGQYLCTRDGRHP